jgi:putative pyoverdin transport system ATP-binding/permease protein
MTIARILLLVTVGLLMVGIAPCISQGRLTKSVLDRIDQEVRHSMKEGDIPGLSLVIIDSGQTFIRTYGYADLGTKTPVTAHTLFQLASCSKAFTAMAVMKLAGQGMIDLQAPVTSYLPWFHPVYKDSPATITVLQLLHHTSGIPWQTISAIPPDDSPDALERTIKEIAGISLRHQPGKQYEYATINYDILALIIEKVMHRPFETFLQTGVLDPLRLNHTSVGSAADNGSMATGYKIGLFLPRPYKAPVYRANNAAGYVITDASDMALWLSFQLGLGDSALYPLAVATHQRDETVPLHGMNAYAMGWEVSLSGNGVISHEGANPNYTAYVSLRQMAKTGVAVLANSNSNLTPAIGDHIMKILAAEKIPRQTGKDESDAIFSLVSALLTLYLLAALSFLGYIIHSISKGRRKFEPLSPRKAWIFLRALLILSPFLLGIYILPKAIAGFTWESIIVWTPVSFLTTIILILAGLALSYFIYFVSLCFPEKDPLKRVAPGILLMSILSGVANMALIILLTSSLDSPIRVRYLMLYFLLAFSLYLIGRSYFQKNLIRFTRGLIYELRIRLIDRIFSTSFQRFEKMDRGRVYTALNDDVDAIGDSASLFVMLITSLITAMCAFFYLSTIAFWTTLLTLLLLASLCGIYYFVSKRTNIYFRQARDIRNLFMRLINGMIDGFKEISLHHNKKLEYKNDVAACAHDYRDKMSRADFRFVDSSLLGESLLLMLLGAVAFAVPILFPDIRTGAVTSFIIILLYLGSSINQIVNGVPSILRLRIAWHRIRQFLEEIPANLDLSVVPVPVDKIVESIRAEGVKFHYKGKEDQEVFEVGPIDLQAGRGEIIFIIGGNGSGKTTLAKLLVGLYEPDEGWILINDRIIESSRLGEYFSTAFNPAFLFEKLYNIDVRDKKADIEKYLKTLHLDKKVTITENRYSTIDLSGGQKKRLALLQCYLEDSPIYLFDEWAADQDPAYRNFFYRILLPEMKKMGKIVIAITHDDHYFDAADKIFKMTDGKLEVYAASYLFTDIDLPSR